MATETTVAVRCDRYPQLRVHGLCRFVDGVATVPLEVAEQLRDLGGDYGIVIDGPAPQAAPPPPPAPPATTPPAGGGNDDEQQPPAVAPLPEDLDDRKRAQLNELAAALGVTEPDKLPNKGEVLQAIRKAHAAAVAAAAQGE